MGAIVATGRPRYEITAADRLWAARMLVGESGTDRTDGAAVLWTMTQRFALGRWPTLTALFRAYSQPINPIWSRTGSMCRPGGRFNGRPECSSDKLARRDRISNLPSNQIPDSIRVLVDAWADGEVPNPVPRAVEFADPAVTAGFVRRNEGSVYVARLRNHYVATAQSKLWAPDRVRIEGGGLSGTTIAAIGGGSVLLLAGIATLAYFMVRS